MNQQGNAPTTPPGSGCTPFPQNSFLCGALGGIFPDSPEAYNAGQNCGACEENNGKKMETAMESLDEKFRPHLCEDREFYVINNGAISADAESLSLPSFSHDFTAKSESPPRREGVPSFDQEQHLDVPYSSMMYSTNDSLEEQFGTPPKAATPTRAKGNKFVTPVEKGASSKGGSEFVPSMAKDTFNEGGSGVHQDYDSERLRNLVSTNTVSPERDEQPSNRARSYMPSVVQPCMATPQPQQPPETMVVYNDDYEAGQIQNYWKEKFEQAATKVIENSGPRCMEIIDPTIPRASDAQARLVLEQQSSHSDNRKKRQHYRNVLQKYKKHRLLVLILEPSCKLYEVLELPFRPDETTVADVLIMARIQTTDDRLRYQEYAGLCRPQLEPPPPPKTPPRYPGSRGAPKTPTRVPSKTRATGNSYYYSHNDDFDDAVRDRDAHSVSSESTANTGNHSHPRYNEITNPESLVANMLPPQSRSESPTGLDPSCLKTALPYFTLPFLGDIVVTIPEGYSGEEINNYAQTILQTPMFLRWLHKRYLKDLQRDNDELLIGTSALDNEGNKLAVGEANDGY